MWVLQKLVVGKAQLWSYYGINKQESLKLEQFQIVDEAIVHIQILNGSLKFETHNNSNRT